MVCIKLVHLPYLLLEGVREYGSEDDVGGPKRVEVT